MVPWTVWYQFRKALNFSASGAMHPQCQQRTGGGGVLTGQGGEIQYLSERYWWFRRGEWSIWEGKFSTASGSVYSRFHTWHIVGPISQASTYMYSSCGTPGRSWYRNWSNCSCLKVYISPINTYPLFKVLVILRCLKSEQVGPQVPNNPASA